MKYIVAIIIALFTTQQAFASKCGKLQFEDAYKEATMVFSGKATTIKYLDERLNERNSNGCGNKLVTFDVLQSWKGTPTNGITVFSADSCLFLGAPFAENEDYLVYVYPQHSNHVWKDKDKGYEYNTGVCVRTDKLTNAGAKEDIELLNNMKK